MQRFNQGQLQLPGFFPQKDEIDATSHCNSAATGFYPQHNQQQAQATEIRVFSAELHRALPVRYPSPQHALQAKAIRL